MNVLLKVVLQTEINQGVVAKWHVFLLLYRLVKIFAKFIENNFIEIFRSSCKPTGNVFVQDGDPTQNSKAAKTALDKIGAVQFSIHPRSPDLNPIKNGKKINKQ